MPTVQTQTPCGAGTHSPPRILVPSGPCAYCPSAKDVQPVLRSQRCPGQAALISLRTRTRTRTRDSMAMTHLLPGRSLRLVARVAGLWLLLGGVILVSRRFSTGRLYRLPVRPPGADVMARRPRVPCYGPRGRLLSESPDDELRVTRHLEGIAYPTPFIGSHRELGAEQTWMTADARYGPYGFEHDTATPGNNRSRVDWDAIRWGALQNECLARNRLRFPGPNPPGNLTTEPRLSWKNQSGIEITPDPTSVRATGRTALLIRSWAGYAYRPQDLWNIRALIVEAGLRTGGEYVVVLYVHVQDRDRNIFASSDRYDAALAAAGIPPELRSIAVLWDENLLESWYERVPEHRTMFQVSQPVQLFALHYPDFDHYWQIELDERFLGDAGKYLNAVAAFARAEPRKQALERATFPFNDGTYGTYANLTARVDAVNNGRSRAWGPLRIPDIRPLGPAPPVRSPRHENFTWGVGEDADVIVSSFCADVAQTPGWVFHDWLAGAFVRGRDTPRWFCPPAIMRGSRRLLLAVHQAQHDRGLGVPSEATLPSWALWHGFKMSYPPQPAYMRRGDDAGDDGPRDDGAVTPWFGNRADRSVDGLGDGNPQSWADRGMSFWWASDYPRTVFDVWLAGGDGVDEARMPGVLAAREGRVYAPNMVMHPVKS
ncbi:hypothetical protein E4U53_001944 [Claviceps sorghi]|nr:hypothetical protein E4U53_001944 [Claviceps sorghi]